MSEQNKLREILEQCMDERMHVRAGHPDGVVVEWKDVQQVAREAEQAILEFINEVIGEDEDWDNPQNHLRAEQRKRAGL